MGFLMIKVVMWIELRAYLKFDCVTFPSFHPTIHRGDAFTFFTYGEGGSTVSGSRYGPM